MKPGDTGLDDLINELLYVLDQDGRRPARAVRWLFICAYRVLKAAMLLALRLPWRSEEQPYPEPGYEPFNLTPEEMAREWGQR